MDWVADAEYRILEASDDGLSRYEADRKQSQQRDDRDWVDDLRVIDHTVLTCITEGKDDTHRITSATGYPNHKVNYCFDKLEKLGLINVGEPKPVERITDDQKRVFDAKPVALTPEAEEYFESTGR